MTVWAHMLIWVTLVVTAYALIANRLFYFGSRLRERAVELGTSILDDDAQSKDVKDGVQRLLLVIPRTSQTWICAAVVIPALISVLRDKWSGRPRHRPAFVPPLHTRQYKDWHEFSSLAIGASVCNSPAAAFLFGSQVFLGSFVISMDAIARQVIANLKHHEQLVPVHARVR